MDTKAVADALVGMWSRGEWLQSGERFWADDVRSVEAVGGEMGDIRGKAAVRGKGEWWAANHEVHSAQVSGGPWINGDAFVVRFSMDLTSKLDGQRRQLDEVGVYTIRDGQIAEERFFYGGM